MRKLVPVAALAAALAVAACDKPRTQSSAYNNSGASATPAMPPASAPSETAETVPKPLASQAPAVSDTTSPSTAQQPAAQAPAK